MIIYGLKTCDTCRAAQKALPEAEFVDVRASPLDEVARSRFLDSFGEALVNKRSTTWRTLSEDEKMQSPGTLLAAHPTLMKRPLIDAGGTLYLGWDAGVRDVLL